MNDEGLMHLMQGVHISDGSNITGYNDDLYG